MAKKRGNGEGTIFHRKDGSWQGQITTGRDSKGKPKRETFYGKTRSEVAEKLNKKLNDLMTGNHVEPNKVTVEQWFDNWLWQYKKLKLRPNTFTSYEQNIRIHIKPALGHYLLQELKADHIQRLINDKLENGRADKKGGLSPSSVIKINNIIQECLDQAVKNQLLIKNVCELTELPALGEKDVRVFTLVEQEKFMDVIQGDRLEAAFLLDLATGLRIGELIALRWKDVNLETGVLKVTQSLNRVKDFNCKKNPKTVLKFGEIKTKSGKRSIPIPQNVVDIMKEYAAVQENEKQDTDDLYEDKNLVFCTELGKPIEPRNMMRKFYSFIHKAAIPKANFHSMRHTFATRALEAGIHPKVVQEMLGHANIAITLNTYSHALPETKKAAAEQLNYLFDRKKKPDEEE